MPVEIEFASMDGAKWAREEFADALSGQDDRRRRTVQFDENELSDHQLEEIVAVAERSRAEREGPGQVSLTAAERDRIDFSKARASVPHARSVKAIMLDAGVDDWTAYYDPTLTVDEHREVADRAARDESGTRLDAPNEDRARGRLEQGVAERCDHAEGFCRRGDPEACEFLGEACGFSEDDIDRIMGMESMAPSDVDTPLSGKQLGALRRAWGGYFGAIDELENALEQVREADRNATEAFTAVNAIRAEAGQEPIEPRRLDEIREMDLSEVCDTSDPDPEEVLEARSSQPRRAIPETS